MGKVSNISRIYAVISLPGRGLHARLELLTFNESAAYRLVALHSSTILIECSLPALARIQDLTLEQFATILAAIKSKTGVISIDTSAYMDTIAALRGGSAGSGTASKDLQ